MASYVVSTRRRASWLGSPTKNMRLVSPNQPSLMTATSMLTMSPFFKILPGEGMPWHTTSLTEVRMVLGYPRYPTLAGTVPCTFTM